MNRRRFNISLFSTLAALMAAALMAGSASAAEITVKFAGQNPPTHHATKSMEDFAAEVARESKGRIEVKVFPSNQLGDKELVFEELIRGTIEMAQVSFSSNFDHRLDLIYASGFTSSYERVAKVYEPNGWFFQKLDEFCSDLGVKLLGMYLEGMVGMCSVKEIANPLDPNVDHGVLMRIPNHDVFMTALQAANFGTISIPFADVYQSLQTGVCDGDMGYSLVAAYTILGDVIKHWYNYNKNVEVLGIMISRSFWDSLSAVDKEIIQNAAERQAAQSILNAEAEDMKHLELMRKKGIQVHMYTQEELRPMMEAFAGAWKQLDRVQFRSQKGFAGLTDIDENYKQTDHLCSSTIDTRQSSIMVKENPDDPKKFYHNV